MAYCNVLSASTIDEKRELIYLDKYRREVILCDWAELGSTQVSPGRAAGSTCTNHAGNHRRQRSTPTLQGSYQSILPGSPSEQISARQHHSFGNHVQEETRAPEEQTYGRSVEGLKRQQDGQLFSQATQQTTSRPGYPHGPNKGHSTDHPQEQPSLPKNVSDSSFISTEAINALLMDLQPAISGANYEMPRHGISGGYSSEHNKTNLQVELNGEQSSKYEVANVGILAGPHYPSNTPEDRMAKRKQHISLDLTNSHFIVDFDCLHRPETPARQQCQGL
ncbi:uncharacterized protein KY384_005929 [Bacidia gigantensis]|uniref:uncharacterized protein n=1 Tax=Bacidia gigantensis TaxID=2732470 RepID=UPI001D053E4E|nr:uncharacterized protein KY384_005929 [Bacidia gigantensis]KAG8529294.1 hypothetical protein KY384_005929 [Bacidia gigantensis]